MTGNSWKPIAEIAQDVASGKTTARSLVEKSLSIIKQKQEYKAIIVILEEKALSRADEIDKKIKKGEDAGKLAGVPFIAKDNFLVFGADTTAASNILKGFDAPYQATAINKLEAEDAICIAKANMDAFGHGSSTENSDFFTTLNPYDKTRVPGGSSGGSAAAVALEMVPFATGTDTGSSIRLPAAFCNVVGLKPTYGLVSRSGVVAMGSSLDCVGPIAKNVEDASLILDVIAGKDDLDMTMIDRDEKSYTALDLDLKGKKIALIEEYLDKNTETGIKEIVQDSLNKFEKAGAKISRIRIPSMSLSLPVYYILCLAELSSNLSRYDGQRYGYSYKNAKDLDESYTQSRDFGFGDEAKRRIMIGTYVLSSGYYDAYYRKAQVVRTKLIKEFNDAFKDADFLVGAVSPSNPFKIGEKAKNPLEMYLSDLYVTGANLVGVPSISVPAGFSGGLSVGLQILAPQKKDRELLSVAKAFEELAA